MATKRNIKNGIEQLQNRTTADQNGEVSYYEHPETGKLYDRFKTVVDEPTGIVIQYPWHMAPFVVEREKAEAEGWEIVASVDEPAKQTSHEDLVEVSEWCVNPWVDNPEDRGVIAEQ